MNIKPITAANYRRNIEKHLKDWTRLALTAITPKMAQAKHRELGNKRPIAANNVMRILRLLFNSAREQHEDDAGNSPIPESPTRKLKRAWNVEERWDIATRTAQQLILSADTAEKMHTF